eukprot:TRINITY_DN6038_c1_g1_i1.p1 TRINITY_DN6038_c1_g1~~TRINITY_DN6038_c1_g1_i1.p1  ORF type:complete len:363 (-),score=42.85 TRINITY_DN6038_c1_g1_i1:144-1232(-)
MFKTIANNLVVENTCFSPQILANFQVLVRRQQIRSIHAGFVLNVDGYKDQEQKVKTEPIQPVSKDVWKQTRDSVDRITSAVYTSIPTQVKDVLEGSGKPGSFSRQMSFWATNIWYEHSTTFISIGLLLSGYLAFSSLSSSEFFQQFSPYIVMGVGLAFVVLVNVLVRRYNSLSPESVYRMTMQRLHKHPGVLEVLGSPVVGSQSRAYVMSGGEIRMKGIYPSRRSRRLQMIFPLKGPERRGIVSVEAKKLKGRYYFKLISLDIPSPSGGEERVFILGNQALYERGHVMNELRVPFIQSLSLQDEYDLEDDQDDLLRIYKQQTAPSLVEQGQQVQQKISQYFGQWRQWVGSFWKREVKADQST